MATQSEAPKTIRYTYPTGQKIEMIFVNATNLYQVYVDGALDRRINAEDVIPALSQFPADTEFCY